VGPLVPAADAATLVREHPRARHARHRDPGGTEREARQPRARRLCVTGDGAAGFHVMEMQSAAREGAKITTPRRSTRWTGPSRRRGGRPVRRSSASRRTAGRTWASRPRRRGRAVH